MISTHTYPPLGNTFYQGRKVFVTGYTGFKGGWLSLWLQAMGAEVHGYALKPPTEPSFFVVAEVGKGMASTEIADIRDADKLRLAMQSASPEIVFHLAAQSLVRYSYVQPAETYAVNVLGTVNLLEAVRATPGVKAVVNVTTDKCYENREGVWGYRENEPMGGFDPYSSSKGCAELVTAAYRRSFLESAGIALASARAGNVVGGGDWADDRLIPDIMRAITQGKSVNIRNPHAIRPWQHVLEPLSGYLLLAQKLYEQGALYAEGWNFGPSDEDAKPVQWIVEELTNAWGKGASWVLDGGDHPHEAHYLKLDCAKAKARLDWRPKWHLESTLGAIIDWNHAFQAGKDMSVFSLGQIRQYVNG
ncbi:MAG: CDP-glucose 4,6-dehydratase [Nitrosomonas sp.]|nr:CDP-glucose 4,6-dehydratase [Nitrosomonas sp.]MDP1951377.1 CDP-glucose 4,6-dehydratase [Nitrosomonas sp.]